MSKQWKTIGRISLTVVLVWLAFYAAKIGLKGFTHNLLIENCVLAATCLIVYGACVWGIENGPRVS